MLRLVPDKLFYGQFVITLDDIVGVISCVSQCVIFSFFCCCSTQHSCIHMAAFVHSVLASMWEQESLEELLKHNTHVQSVMEIVATLEKRNSYQQLFPHHLLYHPGITTYVNTHPETLSQLSPGTFSLLLCECVC